MSVCSCPWCPVAKYIEENGDMCLNVRTNHTNPDGIGYGFEYDPTLTDSLRNDLANILSKTLTTMKLPVKKMNLNDSMNFDVGENTVSENTIGPFNVNLQLLMKSKKVRGDSAFRYWKFCIQKKTQYTRTEPGWGLAVV